MSTPAMEGQFLSLCLGVQVTPMVDPVRIVLLLVGTTRMDGLIFHALIKLLQFVKECPKVCATPILVVRFVMGQFPLRNGVLLMIALR